MQRVAYLLASLLGLAACAGPVTTSQRTVTAKGNNLQITSGTLSNGRFITVENMQKTWGGELKGGKEQWNARHDLLLDTAKDDIERICGQPFYAMRKPPVFNMLDSDETMGGAAPVLGVEVSMVAYLVAEAQTKDANVPASVYMEFNCQGDGKK